MNDTETHLEIEKTNPNPRPADYFKPAYSSEYSDEAWEVKVALPGVKKADLEVGIEDEILEITAFRSMQHPEAWRRLRGEDRDRKYQLKLDIGPEVDDQKVEAKLENGELRLSLPLKETAKPRKIPVS